MIFIGVLASRNVTMVSSINEAMRVIGSNSRWRFDSRVFVLYNQARKASTPDDRLVGGECTKQRRSELLIY
jgi:hypothetical protein